MPSTTIASGLDTASEDGPNAIYSPRLDRRAVKNSCGTLLFQVIPVAREEVQTVLENIAADPGSLLRQAIKCGMTDIVSSSYAEIARFATRKQTIGAQLVAETHYYVTCSCYLYVDDCWISQFTVTQQRPYVGRGRPPVRIKDHKFA